MGGAIGGKGSPGATAKLTSRLANFMIYAPSLICAEHGVECLPQVSDQVVCRIQSNGQPNEAVGNAQALTSFGWNVGVRSGRRVCHQRFNAAKTLGADPQLEGIHYRNGSRRTGVQLEAQHAAKCALLALGEGLLRERVESRVVHARNSGMRLQPAGDGGGALRMGSHATRHSV